MGALPAVKTPQRGVSVFAPPLPTVPAQERANSPDHSPGRGGGCKHQYQGFAESHSADTLPGGRPSRVPRVVAETEHRGEAAQESDTPLFGGDHVVLLDFCAVRRRLSTSQCSPGL